MRRLDCQILAHLAQRLRVAQVGGGSLKEEAECFGKVAMVGKTERQSQVAKIGLAGEHVIERGAQAQVFAVLVDGAARLAAKDAAKMVG